MRALALLLADEGRLLLRSRLVVLVLGAMPLVLSGGALARMEGEVGALVFATFMGASLSGLVCGAMACTSLIGELQHGAPVLFAVRPIPRSHLLVARFLALVLSVSAAMAVSLGIGLAISAWVHPASRILLVQTARSGLVLSLACASLSGAFGVLVGVSARTLLGGALLFLFVGMQGSNGAMLLATSLPRWTGWPPLATDGLLLAGATLLSAGLLWVSARIFARRPL